MNLVLNNNITGKYCRAFKSNLAKKHALHITARIRAGGENENKLSIRLFSLLRKLASS